MTLLEMALRQINFARDYTIEMLNAVEPSEWFRCPTDLNTHVAWQVGHLAFAEYRLALERIRGKKPSDEDLISESFLQHFGRGSSPDPDPQAYPSPEAIRAVFDRVHAQVNEESAQWTEAFLNEPPEVEHKLFDRKIDGLFYCAQHEMLHTGQIALLRRLFGQAPVW